MSGKVLRYGNCAAAFLFLLPVMSPGPAVAAAPSVPMFGSYFPSWLLSFGAAVFLTIVLRIVFVAVGLEPLLRWRGFLYLTLAVGLTALVDLFVI